MKFLATSLLALASVEGLKYASVSKRSKLRSMVNRQIAEMSPHLSTPVALALKGVWDSYDIPSMVPEAVASRIDDPNSGNCEGAGCDRSGVDLSPLMGYACWCFFGNINSAYGRGPPLDGTDAICQRLVLCYRCIFVDAENEGEDCDPYSQSYDATLSVSGINGLSNLTTSCQTNNVANCAWRTCSCTMTMITGFINNSFDADDNYNDDYKHENGFDYALDCPQQGKSQDRQCCGFYPDRRTFDRHSERACCHDRSIYNPLRHQCCEDGSHIGLGNHC